MSRPVLSPRSDFAWLALLWALLALVPLADGTVYGMGRVEVVLFYLMAAIALNLIHGFGGVLMVGQPAMLTLAGYTAGLLSLRLGFEFWVTVPVATLSAVVLSVFMCLPSLRVRGWYLAVLSFMAVYLMPDVIDAFPGLTGGSDGLPRIPPVTIGGVEPPRWLVYELVLVVALLVWLAGRNLIKSGWGTSLLALRDHPFMATAVGVDRIRVRGALFVLTGIPCGIAGGLYVHSREFISPSNFDMHLVLLLIGSVLLGGRGTLWGPILGVTVFGFITLWLGPFSLYNPLFLGLGLMVAAVLFPMGIVGTFQEVWRRRIARKAVASRLLTIEEQGVPNISPVARPPRLAVRGLTKHFGGTYALRDVDLTISGGSITAVIGANGSGKTTLLNCVSGFVPPDSGEVLLEDRSIGAMPPHRRAHLGLARTFQLANVVDELTVAENVALGVYGLRPESPAAAIFRTPGHYALRREALRRAEASCRAVGFTARAIHGPTSQLTLALKHMVEIARALAADASVICFDEPVAGLNLVAQERVAVVLRALASSGRAVLLIEHNLPFVLSVADQLVLLQGGKLVDRGTAADCGNVDRPLGAYFQTYVSTADRARVGETIKAARAERDLRAPAKTNPLTRGYGSS